MISPETLKNIQGVIDRLFNQVKTSFLGGVPDLSRNKRIIFSTSDNSQTLIHLFIKALGNKSPNQAEEEALKQMLSIANSYVDSLKEKTKAQVVSSVSNYYQQQNLRNEAPVSDDLINIIKENMEKSKSQLDIIANAESKNVTNMGNILKITRMASEQGIQRPIVFYNVIYDDRTAEQPEKNIHLIDGTLIPRLWYVDELSTEYWKKGMKAPSIWGGHPNCRCKISYLAPGFGFNESGKITYKGHGHNELREQREKYGMP